MIIDQCGIELRTLSVGKPFIALRYLSTIYITDSSIAHITQAKCPYLTDLNICHNDRLSPSSILHIADNLRSIERLNCAGIQFVSHELLVLVSQNMLNLMHLIISEEDNGRTLLKATKRGEYNLVQLLINSGYNLNLPDDSIREQDQTSIPHMLVGLTPLFWAIKNQHFEIFKLLIRAGASVHATRQVYYYSIVGY